MVELLPGSKPAKQFCIFSISATAALAGRQPGTCRNAQHLALPTIRGVHAHK